MKKPFITMSMVLIFVLFILGVAKADENYDIYVDADNATGIEDGTEANPYNTITEALAAAEANDEDDRRIYINNGTYREQLKLPDSTELYGQDDDDTIIYGEDADGDDFSYVIKMYDHCKIKDLRIEQGDIGVLVNNDSEAKIEDCKIKDQKEIGVEVQKAARNDNEIFEMEGTEIYDSEGKAMYIHKRKIYIEKNEIYDNEEEGIDLRSSVKGKIKRNDIYDNGESGIEFELRRAKLKITSNDLDNNSASGIAAQFRGKHQPGEVRIKRNEIEDNSDYGIKCGAPMGGGPPWAYFNGSMTLINNEIKENTLGFFAPLCHF